MLRLAFFMAAMLLASHRAAAFKEEDFKKCHDASFCTRLRGNVSTSFEIVPASVHVSGPRVTAQIINSQDANGTFVLTLTSYGGTVRLHITEPSAEPPRHEVVDVLLPSLDTALSPWKVLKKSATKLKLRLPAADAEVELRFSPVALAIAVGGKPALTWNAASRFLFEHRRHKQEDDPEGWWAENFKSHHDSKPRGPEAISMDVAYEGFNHVFGLPERAIAHSLPPTRDPNGTYLTEPYRMYNLDVFEYLHDSPFGLYGSIPLMWGHRPGLTAGVFWLNAAEMYVDVEKPTGGGSVASQWIAESGVVDVFFLLGGTPAEAMAQYAAMTGGTALPQLFALGYHQCRWNYKDEEDVALVDAGFDSHAIPYDVLWLDIEHTDGKRYFTWDSNYFPNPAAMQADVASRGRKMVTIVDPHIKRDTAWRIFQEAEQKGLFVKDKDGKDFDGWCWPGSSSYPDWTLPAVRAWWADQFSLAHYGGSTPDLYIWNDMNEPSVFNGPEISMHKDLLHANNAEHRDVHNVYGYYYHMATVEGLVKRGAAVKGAAVGDRPFVLSRAFFAGSQRLGPIWTGDNGAEWEHLDVSVPMLLSLGVAGLPFSGADVGGFFGNPDAELMTRWYQVGAFYPFFRGHAHLESKRREPWLFGEEATTMIRAAIRRRYRLLPYIYTLFAHANVSGAPVMRPLWYEFPGNVGVAEEDRVFMLGPAVAVAPVLRQGETTVRVVLPMDDVTKVWYDAEDGTAVAPHAAPAGDPLVAEFTADAPLDTIRSFLRGGSMLPIKERPRRSSAAMAGDPLTLVIALDHNGEAKGDLYLDDGCSYAFQAGQYAYRAFTFAADGTLAATAGQLPGLPAADPGYASHAVVDKIVVLGLANGPQGWAVQQAAAAAVGGKERMLEAAPGPLYLMPGLPEVALVVRRPQLPADGNWTLKFTRVMGSAAATAK